MNRLARIAFLAGLPLLAAGCGNGGGGGLLLLGPRVDDKVPEGGATGVPLNIIVAATFNDDMDAATITTGSFTIAPTSTGTPVAGTVVDYSASTRTATLTLPGPLDPTTQYAVKLTSAIRDEDNRPFSGLTWVFVTGLASDTTEPNVDASDPADGATNVSINVAITVTFDESLNPATIDDTTFTLSRNPPVAGTVTYDDDTLTATFTPDAPLAEKSLHTATLTADITDTAGNPLNGAPITFSFTTEDVTAPTVTGRNPANGATGVYLTATVTATFSEDMNSGTIDDSTFTVVETGSGTPVAWSSITYNNVTRTATFTPDEILSADTGYTVTITTGAQDLAGNGLAADEVWTFTTIDDGTPPTAAVLNPYDTEIDVATNRVVTVTFDEDMDPATITDSTFTLDETVSGDPVAVDSVDYDIPSRTATLTPSADLTPSLGYTATLEAGITDLAGNPLSGAPFTWSFTTGAGPDLVAPTVGPFSPSDGASDISVSIHQTIGFSEAMDKTSVQNATTVSPALANPLQFFWNTAGDSVTVVFDTQAPVGIHGDDVLEDNTDYTVTVGPTAKDLADNPTGSSTSVTWTTLEDVTPPEVSGFTPDITSAARTFGAGSTLTISFNEDMETTGIDGLVEVEVESISDERDAMVGLPTADLGVAWSGNDLVITFVTALQATSVYQLRLEHLYDLAGNPLREGDEEAIIVTAGSQSGNPTVMVTWPRNGATGVSPDSIIFIGFSRAMAPGVTDRIQLSGAGSTQRVIERNALPRGVLVNPKQAWPGSATITVTVAGGVGGVEDASGNPLASNYTFSFTTAARNTNAWGLDADYSTLKDGDDDVNSSEFFQAFLFKDTAGNRMFPNFQDFAPEDITIREQATGIPLKGYEFGFEADGDLEIREWGQLTVTPLKADTTYELVFSSSTFTNTNTVAISPTTVTFTTAGTNTRPLLKSGIRIEEVETTSDGLEVGFELNLVDPDGGDAVTVTGQSDVDAAFNPTFMETLGGHFFYETPGSDEPDITTRSQLHPITFTISDAPGGHTTTIKRNIFPWAEADLPYLIGPTGADDSTPLYTYSVTSTARAQASIVLIAVVDVSSGDIAFMTVAGVPSTSTGSFQHPADNPLPSGTYLVGVAVAKFSTGTIRGEFVGTGFGVASGSFTVP